jgi:protein N-terminal amidase
MVSNKRKVIANYRKTFLYYTDETWASEGGGFWSGELPLPDHDGKISTTASTTNAITLDVSAPPQRTISTAVGICMDINSYRFQAERTEYGFANHIISSKAKLVIFAQAWLTSLPVEELRDHPDEPDMNTVGYWIARLRPLLDRQNGERGNVRAKNDGRQSQPNESRDEENQKTVGTEDEDSKKATVENDSGEVIVVCANRCGEENEAKYAGSSTVMGILGQRVRCWELLGRGTEGVCVVDTERPALWRLRRVEKGSPDV